MFDVMGQGRACTNVGLKTWVKDEHWISCPFSLWMDP